MHITSVAEVSQTGRRRLRRFAAWLIRSAVAGGLILFFFSSPNEFIYLVEGAFVGFFTGPIVWLLKSSALLAIVYVLAALMSSRKTPVLYLRRFGLSDANRMLARAINGGLVRQHRVITLDDSDFVPLEVPRIERILSRFGIPFALLVFLLAVNSLTGGQGLGLPNGLVVRIMYWFPIAGIWLYQFWLFCLPLLALIVIVLAVLIYRWRIRRSLKVEIRSAEQIPRCLIRVQGLAGWLRRPSIAAPQALVVRVVDKLWQELVSELAERVRLVICDVSEPTDNLIWEVERMSARPEIRCVFVGNGPMVQSWVRQTSEDDMETPPSRMKSLLREQTILVFDPARRLAQRRFNQSLRNRLESILNQATLPARV
jgi:hypothetical protein